MGVLYDQKCRGQVKKKTAKQDNQFKYKFIWSNSKKTVYIQGKCALYGVNLRVTV